MKPVSHEELDKHSKKYMAAKRLKELEIQS